MSSGTCRHGVYVGGCGIDWMCGACEMGDPDPTVNDLFDELGRLMNLRSAHIAIFMESAELSANLSWVPDVLHGNNRAIRGIMEQIAEARSWSEHDDDDQWLARRHAHYEDLDRQFEDAMRGYSEIDEVHEYGYVPS